MAHIFSYAILMATPDPSRGERVNIGIMVFLPERIDIRFVELAKLRALAGGDWVAYTDDLLLRIPLQLGVGDEAEAALRNGLALDPVIHASDLAQLSVREPSEYEARINEILEVLVRRPKEIAQKKSTRINLAL